jgi:hypothetical protein
MVKIDAAERSMPEINPEKVCFIVAQARELMSEDEGEAPDASNPTDDGEREMLTDAAYAPVHSELVQFIDDLDFDEQCALVALVWIGRGDFEPDQWREAVALAAEQREQSVSGALLGIPLLPDYLEEALSSFGFSCSDYGSAV